VPELTNDAQNSDSGNLTDLIYMVKVIKFKAPGYVPNSYLYQADVNLDGRINAIDIAILKYTIFDRIKSIL
jgi:hypothetical protein